MHSALKVISVNCTKFTVNDQLPLNYFAHYTVLVIINHSMLLKTVNRRLKIDVLIVFVLIQNSFKQNKLIA